MVIPDDLRDWAKMVAVAKRRYLQRIMTDALRDWLEKHGGDVPRPHRDRDKGADDGS